MASVATTNETVRQIRVPFVLDRAFDWTMGIFVFITVFLPGGSVYGVNFKSPLYVALLPLAVHSMFRRGLASPGRLALILALPSTLFIWVGIGIFYGFAASSSARQYADVMMTFVMCWLAFVFSSTGDRGRMRFLRLVLAAEVTTSIFKTGLIAYAVLRHIPTVELVATLSTVFGVNLMTMDLGAMLGRVQFVSDALIPSCILIILRYRDRLQIGSLRASLTIMVLFASVAFSFSRYFWALTALAFLMGLALGKRDRFQVLVVALLGATVLLTLPTLAPLLQLRFSSDVAGDSDMVRTEQSVALTHFFEDAPVLGHGLGSYTNSVIRVIDGATNMNYSYEEQLLALCGQIGLVGIALLLLLGLYYYSDLWWRSELSARDRIGITVMIISWLSAGLYNPLLFHPIAGINYAVFGAMAGLRRERLTKQEPLGRLRLGQG